MVRCGTQPNSPVVKIILEVEPNLFSVHPVDMAFANLVRRKFALSEDVVTIPSGEASTEVFAMLAPVCETCLSEWLDSNNTDSLVTPHD